MTNKIPQSPEELNAHLQEQLQFLQASAESYDNGFDGEAKRLAVTVRVLVHDKGQSQSLLGQLGKKTIDFYDTALPNHPGNFLPYSGLIMSRVSLSRSKYLPLLDDGPDKLFRLVNFATWWNAIVLIDGQRNQISRRDIVLAMADKDGGAHVDPSLDEIYSRLSRSNSLGQYALVQGEAPYPFKNPERATVRQIAHEILKTLIHGYRKTASLLPRSMP